MRGMRGERQVVGGAVEGKEGATWCWVGLRGKAEEVGEGRLVMGEVRGKGAGWGRRGVGQAWAWVSLPLTTPKTHRSPVPLGCKGNRGKT